MKKVLYAFLAAAMALTVGSCNYEKDLDIDTNGGKGLEFVHFAASSDSWLVTEDDDSYVFNVDVARTGSPDQAVTYNIAVGAGTTGVEGVDFAIPTKSVTIPAGQYIGSFPVEVLYATTGEGFILNLELSIEESLINPSYGNLESVTVASDKIVIDWNWLVGKWTCQDLSGDPYTVTFTQVDETTVILNNIWESGGDMEGTVDFEARTIAFKGPIPIQAAYGGQLMVAHFNEETEEYDDDYFYAVMSPLGVVLSGHGFYLSGGSYDGYDFGTDYEVMTR
jgi:hypothetical protein